ncbi:MAG TPA: J domain-containing protein [Lacipirellulaceae bacterium]|nr:J domain-containing protein [Lacipirellulaceae bacterium]HMP05737.1 J domain-containing protein [Lacipirellulaceae bacterium]
MRRALAVVAGASVHTSATPEWALRDRPPCLTALGLDLNSTEEQVMAAYRQYVKRLHPDHGGNLQQFLRLQRHLDQALALVRRRGGGRRPSTAKRR